MNTGQSNWMLYDRVLLSVLPPHIPKKEEEVADALSCNKALFARYTSNFDCGHYTEWWYCLKDDALNINSLKAKHRYEITSSLKKCKVCEINPSDYLEALFKVSIDSFADYPLVYRPKLNLDNFKKEIASWKEMSDTFGCFDVKTNELCGYCVCKKKEDIILLSIVKVTPKALSMKANAAILYYICEKYLNGTYKYICDGERNIRHVTNFQDYLVKYFGFRYVYCDLNIVYNPYFGLVVKILYPFRNLIKKIARCKLLYNVYCVLKQEEYARSFK